VAQREFTFDGGHIHLNVTVGRLFLPDGTCFDDIGIKPDVYWPRSAAPTEPEAPFVESTSGTRTLTLLRSCRDPKSKIEAFYNRQDRGAMESTIELIADVPEPAKTHNAWLKKSANRIVHHARNMMTQWLTDFSE